MQGCCDCSSVSTRGGLPAAALCSVGLLCSSAAPGAAKPALPALGLLVLGDSAPTQSSKASR